MHRSLTILALVFVLAACGDHTEGVSSATVSEATPAAATAPSAASRETLALDRASSSVGFTGAKVTGSHDGTFSDFTGSIELDPQDLAASAVRVTIQMSSLAIEPERLQGHLLSPDFFDAPQFPTAAFESTAVRAGSEGTVGGQPATHTITGNLTMRGQTRSVSFPAIVTVEPSGVRARSEFSINRRDFQIVYAGMPDDLIRDEVVIRFDVRAPRGA
jgi:polyisoprenoid-binding protein YceI